VSKLSWKSWAVFDANKNKILFGKNVNTRLEIASLTKIMTWITSIILSKKYKLNIRKTYI